MKLNLKYVLNIRQRALPLLYVWGQTLVIIVILQIVCSYLSLTMSAWFGVPTLMLFLFLAPFVVSIINIMINPHINMDVIIEEKGIGLLVGKERRWIFTDGITSVQKLLPDVWTITHYNGTVINIPCSIIPESAIEELRQNILKGRKASLLFKEKLVASRREKREQARRHK